MNIDAGTLFLVNGQAIHELQTGETVPIVTVLGITGPIS